MVDQSKFPSLELVYNQVKDVLQHQGQIRDTLTVKATFLWSSATVVLAIVLSIAQSLASKLAISVFSLLIFTGICYLVITILCWLVVTPQKLRGTAINFDTLEEQLIVLSPFNYMSEMIGHIKEAHNKNRKQLSFQGWYIYGAGIALLSMIGMLLYWVFKFYPYFLE